MTAVKSKQSFTISSKMLTSKILGVAVKPKTQFVLTQLLTRNPQVPVFVQRRGLTSKPYNFSDKDRWISKRIGNREVVGFGVNGQPEYVDRADYPFPSIRFKEPSSEIQALREKEKGDWRLLSVEEKKAIYRASFCQTFAEFQAPTGEWMYIVGITLILTSIGLWLFILMKIYVYRKEMPPSFKPKYQVEQLRRIILMHNNPITGLASKWDYKKMKWKKKPWYIPWDDPFEDLVECEEDLTD